MKPILAVQHSLFLASLSSFSGKNAACESTASELSVLSVKLLKIPNDTPVPVSCSY